MARVGLGAILTLCILSSTELARGQDAAPITSLVDGGELGPLVALRAIDPDALTEVVKQLGLRGYDPEGTSLDEALRAFVNDRGLESPEQAGYVAATTLDALGAGHAIALRWPGRGPRAPELSAEETWRLNAALWLRGYTTREPRSTVDEETVSGLRDLQRATGHPVQRGDLIERRWLYILGVATEESIPRSAFEQPASSPSAPVRPSTPGRPR